MHPEASEALLRFGGVVPHDPAIDAWLQGKTGALGELARHWFARMRACGDEVREVLHDGCPNACFGDVPFAYVNVYAAHVGVGFFLGAQLRDPAKLLEGSGRRMRHVKLRPGKSVAEEELEALIVQAYDLVKSRVERGD